MNRRQSKMNRAIQNKIFKGIFEKEREVRKEAGIRSLEVKRILILNEIINTKAIKKPRLNHIQQREIIIRIKGGRSVLFRFHDLKIHFFIGILVEYIHFGVFQCFFDQIQVSFLQFFFAWSLFLLVFVVFYRFKEEICDLLGQGLQNGRLGLFQSIQLRNTSYLVVFVVLVLFFSLYFLVL